MSMDRLVELFLESARPEGEAARGGPPFGGGAPDAEAIERGVAVVEKMLSSEDAVRMGGSPSATFVCLGMAMEEKPKLNMAAIRCYEKSLEYLERRATENRGGWERCVVLQQMGAVAIRSGRCQEAQRWLEDCAEVCRIAPGHPRDADLFSGAFNTQQTRMEFSATIEKMRAQCCAKLGDQQRAYEHLAESQRLEQYATGDAVERQMAQKASPPSAEMAATSAVETPKQLWAATPDVERVLRQYAYMDEGPTVSVILELNEHLGIGPEASEVVQSLQQFRVRCEGDSVEIQLRIRRRSGEVCHLRWLLAPLSREIVPEDTVPRLRGKPSRRRLEVKLFKREKHITWYGDIVSDAAPKKRSDGGPPAAEKGSLFNPLTPEEIARLPKPSGDSSANRPSTWQPAPSAAKVGEPVGTPSAPSRPAAAEPAGAPPAAAPSPSRPAWVGAVREDEGQLAVVIGEAAGPCVDLSDLDLVVDAAAGVVRLRLLAAGAPGADRELELRLPAGADAERMAPKWRRKARTLELRFPAE